MRRSVESARENPTNAQTKQVKAQSAGNNAGQSQAHGGNGGTRAQGVTGSEGRKNQAASSSEKNVAGNSLSVSSQGAKNASDGAVASQEAQFRIGAGKNGTAWPKRKLSSVNAPSEEIAQWMLSPDPEEKMKAIQAAISYFKIKGSGYHLFYNPKMDWASGATNPWGDVEIGPLSFRSWSELGETLGHEIEIHWERQFKVNGAVTGGMYSDEWYMREIEADRYEISNAHRFGRTSVDTARSRRHLDEHYKEIKKAGNRNLVDKRIYEIPGTSG